MRRSAHLSETVGGAINPTELVATLINHEDSFEAVEGCAAPMT